MAIETLATSTDAPPGALVGWLVVLREHDQWSDTWDAQVHSDHEKALISTQQAFEDGYDSLLVELRVAPARELPNGD